MDAHQKDITESENVAAEQISQEKLLKRDQVYPVKAWESVDSPVCIEQSKTRNAQETFLKDCQSPDMSSTDKVTLNIFDDEVWESPGATV